MKNLSILMLCTLLCFSCSKSSTDEEDETFIDYTNISPNSGLTITSPTNIEVNIKYNISTHEVFGDDIFILNLYRKGKHGDVIIMGKKRMESRYGEYYDTIYSWSEKRLAYFSRHGPDTLYYWASLSRKESERIYSQLDTTEKLIYFFE